MDVSQNQKWVVYTGNGVVCARYVPSDQEFCQQAEVVSNYYTWGHLISNIFIQTFFTLSDVDQSIYIYQGREVVKYNLMTKDGF
mmetsp:Transcript_39616/g.35383  ORF Transcript_39616/g.35383 Transcript_39616/m.35383 type:complete len:84 (+) Transcript_39616:822-1073(+)